MENCMSEISTEMSIADRLQSMRDETINEEALLMKDALNQLATILIDESKSVLNITVTTIHQDLKQSLIPIEKELENSTIMAQKLNQQFAKLESQTQNHIENSLKSTASQVDKISKDALSPFRQTMKQVREEAEMVRRSLSSAWLRPFLTGVSLCLGLWLTAWIGTQVITTEIVKNYKELTEQKQSIEMLKIKNGAIRMHLIDGKSYVSVPMNWTLEKAGEMKSSGRPVFQLVAE